MDATASSEPTQRGRFVLVLALAAVFMIGAVVAVLLGFTRDSQEDGGSAAVPDECLAKWNGDQAALSYARHNRTFHNYSAAQVGYMPDDGSRALVSNDPGDGSCVVVFARPTLDPEPGAAGQVERDGRWTPLTQVVVGNDLEALQSAALKAPNARPTELGELEPL